MGFKNWFKTQSSPPIFTLQTVEDPYLGEITSNEYNLWTCTKYFAPIRGKVGVVFEAGPEGPTDIQRDFFRQIEDRYLALLNNIQAAFVESTTTLRKGPAMQDVFDSLELNAIVIDAVDTASVDWEMEFATELNDHIITFVMKDWNYKFDRWDG